jgi:hypothetical protein
MIRNLKFPMAVAAVALTAFGAVSISGADTAEFHCSVKPCQITVKPDGTGKTAHQVISLWGKTGSFQTTCSTISGEATASSETFSEITVSNIKGSGCTVLGQPAELKMNGCDYLFRSSGTLTITCPPGKEIEDGISGGGCLYFIPPQGPLPGLTFHNLESNEITIETQIKGLTATTNGECGISGTVEAEYTTGNTILTAETDPGGVKANLSWE